MGHGLPACAVLRAQDLQLMGGHLGQPQAKCLEYGFLERPPGHQEVLLRWQVITGLQPFQPLAGTEKRRGQFGGLCQRIDPFDVDAHLPCPGHHHSRLTRAMREAEAQVLQVRMLLRAQGGFAPWTCPETPGLRSHRRMPAQHPPKQPMCLDEQGPVAWPSKAQRPRPFFRAQQRPVVLTVCGDRHQVQGQVSWRKTGALGGVNAGAPSKKERPRCVVAAGALVGLVWTGQFKVSLTWWPGWFFG